MVLLAIQPPAVSVSAAAVSVVAKGITFIRKMELAAAAISVVCGETVAKLIPPVWKNEEKSTASWFNEPKS
jgi:hypothetical protein